MEAKQEFSKPLEISDKNIDIEEKRDLEQYFFDKKTARKLFDIFVRKELFENKKCCFLCCPILAEIAKKYELEENTALFDIDERFDRFKNYKKFDLVSEKMEKELEKFDIIICDPPFFGVEINQLGKIIASLLKNDGKAYVIFLKRRGREFYRSMENMGFEVEKLDFKLDYETIKNAPDHMVLYKLQRQNEKD